jgi:hypothetical protein
MRPSLWVKKMMWLLDSIFENKGYLHLDAILCDFSILIDDDFLVLDPCTADVLEGFVGAHNSCLDCIVKTLGRR